MAKNLYATLKKVKAMGYDGVEFAGLYGHTPEEVRDVMRNDEDGEYTSIPVENPDLDKQKEIEEIIRKVDGDDGGAEA
mgnify:CR=1 FL=1